MQAVLRPICSPICLDSLGRRARRELAVMDTGPDGNRFSLGDRGRRMAAEIRSSAARARKMVLEN
jgi:hypothetical protein